MISGACTASYLFLYTAYDKKEKKLVLQNLIDLVCSPSSRLVLGIVLPCLVLFCLVLPCHVIVLCWNCLVLYPTAVAPLVGYLNLTLSLTLT
jgi:hypothetical protein